MKLINTIRRRFARNAANYRGWRTERKIVVIESDDWGSTCMPSADTFQKLVRKGLRVDQCPYTSFDALASEEDLEDLFSVLTEFRDVNNVHPSLTANVVMSNPDFAKIRESGFREYHGVPFTECLMRYPLHRRSFTLWKQGMSDHLFFPQFHGREHLNVKAWMKSLQEGQTAVRSVFDEEMFWPGSKEENSSGVKLRAAFDAEDLSEIDYHKEIIREGLEQFENFFGYRSKSFIAPNFIYHPALNKSLFDDGVNILQGMKYQKLPITRNDKRELIRRVQGEKNDLGQHFLVRNCDFEPSQLPVGYDIVDTCLKDIESAFFWKKPAVITAHRLNFIGFINPENRERNLNHLRKLLKHLLKKWPDTEFMTSVELGELIKKSTL